MGKNLDELRIMLGKPTKSSSVNPERNLDELRNILGKQKKILSKEERGANLSKELRNVGRISNEEPEQALHGLVEGAISLPNLVQAPIGIPWWLARQAGAALPEMPMLSELGAEGLKKLGYDLSANQPKTAQGHVARNLASFAVPAGPIASGVSKAGTAIGKYAPKIGKGLEKFSEWIGPKNILSKESAKASALGAGTGAGVGALEYGFGEGGEPYAQGIGGIGIPLTVAGVQALRRKGPKVSPSQQRVQDLFEAKMSPEERASAIQAIERNNLPENFVEGYQPTTAEVAESPTLAGIERALTGQTTSPEYAKLSKRQIEQNEAILSKINDMVPEGYTAEQAQDFIKLQYDKLDETVRATEELAGTKAAESVLENFLHRETPQEAGKQIQRTIGEEIVEPLKEERRKKAEKSYSIIEESKQRAVPKRSEKFLEYKLKNASGSMKNMLQNLQNSLRAREKDVAEIEGKVTKGAPRIGELEGVKQDAQQMLSEAKPGSPKSAILKKFIVELDKDLEVAPDVKKASKEYREASIPISEFEKHPTIGPDIARNVRKEFKTKQANVINKYVKGNASRQYARELYPHIKNDKKTMEAIEGYINGDVLDSIIDANTGHIKKNSLDKWNAANPGAFELYPKLETKLSNTSNATKFYRDVVEQNAKKVKEFRKSAAAKFLDRDPDKVAANIISTNKSIKQMDEVVSELKKDKTGDALKGFQRSFSEFIGKNFKTLGEGNTNVSIAKFNNLILNKTKTLSKLYDEEQMDTLNKIHKSLLSRNKKMTLWRTSGSETAPKINTTFDLMVSGLGKGKLSKIPYLGTTAKLVAAALEKFSEFRDREYDALFVKTMMEPEFAKIIFTNIENKKPKEIEKMISNYLKNSAVKTANELSQEE